MQKGVYSLRREAQHPALLPTGGVLNPLRWPVSHASICRDHHDSSHLRIKARPSLPAI